MIYRPIFVCSKISIILLVINKFWTLRVLYRVAQKNVSNFA